MPGVPLTVVTVFKDNADALERTLRSVQTNRALLKYASFEHILVDGGYTSAATEIAREYCQNEGQRLLSGPDRGIYDGMNRGLRVSSGEFVQFLNSGDSYASPDSLQRAVKRLECTSDEWVVGLARQVSASGRQQGPILDYSLSSRRILWGEVYVCHQAMFVRRRLLERINGFDESYSSAGDFASYLSLLHVATPVPWGTVVVDFEVGGVSTSLRRRHLWEMHRARCQIGDVGMVGRIASAGLTEARLLRHELGKRSPDFIKTARKSYLQMRHGQRPS